MTKLISDYAKVEISNKVKDILRMYHSSSWNSEPYHQNQSPAEGRYCTLKSWTNTIMNRSGAPADCWLLCMIHASYILNHLSCEALGGKVPLGMLYGVSPDISILLLYTFYQPVFYATHNQSYPSSREERAARWVVFGEHVGDALTHKLLDDDTKKILYRSAVRPSDSTHPNKHLVSDGGEISQTLTRAPHAQPSLSNFTRRDSDFGEPTRSRGTTRLERNFPTSPKIKRPNLHIVRYTCHCEQY